jgi:hypothetical protein
LKVIKNEAEKKSKEAKALLAENETKITNGRYINTMVDKEINVWKEMLINLEKDK